MDKDLLFLTKCSVNTFLVNWRKIQEELLDRVTQELKTDGDKKWIAELIEAKNNYGLLMLLLVIALN